MSRVWTPWRAPEPGGEPVPGSLNLALFVSASAAAAALLYIASHAGSWPARLVAAAAFSFVNNTLFSLLHESVHGLLHRDRSLNEWLGRLAAAWMPTGLTLQRIFHLGHHRRNRTEAEQFDYYRPGDKRWLRAAQWYAILTGLYWVFVPVGALAYLLSPRLYRLRALRAGDSKLAQQTSADAMLGGFDGAPAGKIRLEILFSAAFQAALFLTLDLNAWGWATCYAAFALNWSSLQYADHAWSELDVRNGAWNLRVNPIVQAFFLNYHHHRAHHQNPRVPWLQLPNYVDAAAPRPSFLSVYLAMWAGPRPLPAGAVLPAEDAPSD